MEIILIFAGSILMVIALMIFQLGSMKKYHPNAELLIGMFRLIGTDSGQNRK